MDVVHICLGGVTTPPKITIVAVPLVASVQATSVWEYRAPGAAPVVLTAPLHVLVTRLRVYTSFNTVPVPKAEVASCPPKIVIAAAPLAASVQATVVVLTPRVRCRPRRAHRPAPRVGDEVEGVDVIQHATGVDSPKDRHHLRVARRSAPAHGGVAVSRARRRPRRTHRLAPRVGDEVDVMYLFQCWTAKELGLVGDDDGGEPLEADADEVERTDAVPEAKIATMEAEVVAAVDGSGLTNAPQ